MKKRIKVSYFSADTSKDKVLGSNGKSLDKYCVKCETEEDLSTGNYIVDLKFLITDNIHELLQEEVILKILLDYGNEIFRISKVTVGTRYIDVVARQITIADSRTLYLKDVRPTKLNGQAALTWILDNAVGVKEIQFKSNISGLNTAYYIDKSIYEAIHDSDNSFISLWGGEILRRQYTVTINSRIGVNRGVVIREGKNLKGFESNSNIDNLITRAKGKGFNGIEGNYIDSPLINNYNHIYTKVIKYEDVKVKDENSDEGFNTLEEAKVELDRRINEEFSKNDIDKIKASYNVNFIQLEQTEEYKNYVQAERVFIGDTIRVYIPKLQVDINVRVIKRRYDCVAQRVKEIKLSNYIEPKPLSIKQVIEKLEEVKNDGINNLQQAKEFASALIKSGLKNSYVIVRENEIVIGDTKDINTMTKCWRFNNNGLGYSSTGYYGEFGLAMTMDGSIVADFINTGVLNAAIVKSGILKSFNNITWIDMENGTFSFANKIKFDGENFDIDLSNKGLATDGDIETLQTQITANANGIKEKVDAGYVSQEITKSAESTIFKFTSNGGYNLLRNSKAKNGMAYWYDNGGGIGDERDGAFGTCFRTSAPSGISHDWVKLRNDTDYIYQGYIYSRQTIGGSSLTPLHFWCSTTQAVGQAQATIISFRQEVPYINVWVKCYVHFKTKPTGDVWFKPFVYVGGEEKFDLWATELSLVEGKVETAWTPHPSEIYEGSTIIDGSGVTVNNGALRVKNNAGTTVLEGDSNGNLTLTGRVVNGKNGYTSYLERGGLILETTGEKVGYVRSSSFASNRSINGLSLGMLGAGDYVDIGYTNDSDLAESTSLAPMIRLAKTIHSLIGNFRGIQLKENTRIDYAKSLSFQNNTSYESVMFANSEGHLCEFGDNGVILGYREGDSNKSMFQINETPGSSGSQVYISGQLSMQDKKIVSVPDIYAGASGTRYYHEGWVGSIEKIAKRISNLNVLYDTGVYSFSNGSNGAPCQYGTLIHVKWGSSGDASQLVVELVTGKLFTRATSHDVSTWSAWTEK